MSVESQASSERIKLVYRSKINDEEQEVELPFRLLVLGNFSCNEQADFFSEQAPININKDNFDQVMLGFAVELKLQVTDRINEQSPEQTLAVNLHFAQLNDFHPSAIIAQSPILSQFINCRTQLLSLRESSDLSEQWPDIINSLQKTPAVYEFIHSFSLQAEQVQADSIDLILTELDTCLGQQLDEILHHPQFTQLEALWRGLYFLIQRSNFNENIIIELLNVSKQAVLEDLEDAAETTQSQLYNTLYSKEFGQFGGKPYSAFIGSYYFTAAQQDVWLLQQLASIAAMAHAPLITAPSPLLFDIDHFSELARVRDLKANFEQPKYAKWQQFRQSDDARYVAMVLPRFILRASYSEKNAIDEFNYKETLNSAHSGLWGHAAFAFASRLLASFAYSRWCLDISGPDHGKVEGLTMLQSNKVATSEKTIPTEILISDRRVSELINWGFIALTVHKGSDHAAFYGACSLQSAKEFANSQTGNIAKLNHQLGSQLPYLYLVCRLSHYLKMMQREHIGSWSKASDIEQELNNWIRQYVTDMDNPTEAVRIRRPLRQAKVTVSEVDGKADWHIISLTVIPHLKYMGAQFTLNETGKLDKN